VGTMQELSRLYGYEAMRSRSHRAANAGHAPRRIGRASLALALSRLEREHVALLLAICELESASDANGDAALREALLPMLREDLRQTQHALALAAHGAYGACEECHRPLAARQLEIKPATTRCPVCAARSNRDIQH
jgi:RNA polymerase-binding transcription factor DksA